MAAEGDGALCMERPHGPRHGRRGSAAPAQRRDDNRSTRTASPYELGTILPDSWSEEAVRGFASYISGQSNLPWTKYTWLGPGHTLPCDKWENPNHTAALLQYEHSGASQIALETLLGDPVNVLWFVPISEDERQVAINQGSERLKSRLPADRWKQA